MMSPSTGTFEPLDRDAYSKNLEQLIPKPTIHEGEVVEVKGVKFIVTYWKPNGKLGLRMVRTAP